MNEPVPASSSWIHADIVGGQVKVNLNDVNPAALNAAIGEQIAMAAAHLVRLSMGVLSGEEAMSAVIRSAGEVAERRLPVHLNG